MARKYIDCREFPSESNCTVAIAADSEKELMEVAVQHAVTTHKHTDSPELREQIRRQFKEGTPPELPATMDASRMLPTAGEEKRPRA